MELEKAKVITNGNVMLSNIVSGQSENNDFEVLVDPKEFGIETNDDKRVRITDIFAFYEKEYNEIVNTTEITPELCEKASSLRKKVGKIRIGIGKIHKAKKEYWLNGGRSVDAWKNENSEIVEQKEKALLEKETHFQRIEQERIAKMRESRIETLKQYEIDGALIPTIAIMDESIWESFLMGEKLKFEAKKEQERLAEQERLRLQQVESLRWKRADLLKPYYSFFTEKEGLNLGECTEEEWLAILNDAKSAKEKNDAEQEKVRLENEKLKEAAKKREAELELERKKQADILAKQKAEAEAKLKLEREEKAKVEAELQLKRQAEAKAKADEEARIEAEASMGDKEKVQALINDLEIIKTKYQFKSNKNKKMYADVDNLISKIVDHIKK